MNFKNFEDGNLGYHFTSKDILIGDEWIKSELIVNINYLRVQFWRKQWELDTYRIEARLTLFGGEEKTVILYHYPKSIADLQGYFNTIFTKIKTKQ